jgi:hypothetical protein
MGWSLHELAMRWRNRRELAIRFRARSVKFLQRRLLGPIAGQIPGQGWTRSLVERLHDPAVACHVVQTWANACHGRKVGFPATSHRIPQNEAFDNGTRTDWSTSWPVHSGLVWLPGGLALEELRLLIRILGWAISARTPHAGQALEPIGDPVPQHRLLPLATRLSRCDIRP